MKIFAVILLYVVCSAFSYAALLADLQSINTLHCRHSAGIALAFALFPIGGEIIAIVGTGFVEHGLQWTCP